VSLDHVLIGGRHMMLSFGEHPMGHAEQARGIGRTLLLEEHTRQPSNTGGDATRAADLLVEGKALAEQVAGRLVSAASQRDLAPAAHDESQAEVLSVQLGPLIYPVMVVKLLNWSSCAKDFKRNTINYLIECICLFQPADKYVIICLVRRTIPSNKLPP